MFSSREFQKKKNNAIDSSSYLQGTKESRKFGLKIYVF